MRRLIFLIGLFALLWAAADRTAPAPQDISLRPSGFGRQIATMSGVTGCGVTGESHAPSDSDRHWRAQQHTIAAVTESEWKSAPVHAALGATLSARAFDQAPTANSLAPPAASAPHYLRHTPLLI